MKKDALQFLQKKYDVTPRKAQGQNFLLNNEIIDDIVRAADLSSDEIVLEIGPGFGVLTTALAERVQKVIAVEQDRNLAQSIRDIAQQQNNIVVENEDIRLFHRSQAGLEDLSYSLVANLPYSVASWILRNFLQYPPRPKKMIVMVQHEVAKRVTAKPGAMSILSVASQLFADVRYVQLVGPENFSPQPKINSAILRCDIFENPRSENVHDFLALVKSGFAARRKTVVNNLKAHFSVDPKRIISWCNDAHIDVMARPQELDIPDWERLRKIIDDDQTL